MNAGAPSGRLVSGRLSSRVVPAVSVGLFVLMGWDTLGSLAAQWIHDPNYAHALFLPALALFVAWRKRKQTGAILGRTSLTGLFALAGSAALLVVGLAAAEHFTARIALVLLGVTLYWTLHGASRTRALGVVWLLLLLSVPLPYVIYYKLTFPLQIFSSKAAAFLLGGAGMPVVRTGNILHLEGYTLEVVTACSGLRSMMTLIAMSVFVGELFGSNKRARVALIAVSIPVAVAINTLRLLVTAGLFALAGPEVADGFLHGVSGIVVFMLGVGVLLGAGKVFSWTTSRASQPS